jgi:hypothetical protein
MDKHVYSNQDINRLLRIEECDMPSCGEVFCDRCGDCMRCASDGCYPGSGKTYPSHFWVEYEDDPGHVAG